MNPSRYIGRIGGLAVALGVGAVVLSNAAIAAAGPDPGAPVAAEGVSAPAASPQPPKGRTARAARTAERIAAAAALPSASTPSTPAVRVTDPKARPAASTRKTSRVITAAAGPAAQPIAPVARPAGASAISRQGVSGSTPRPVAASTLTAVAAPTAGTGTVTPPDHLVKLVFTGIAQVALAFSMSALNFAPPAPNTVTPTLALNGLNIVPNTAETVTSHYGRWSYFPGGLSMVQGQQKFDVVDPQSGETVGGFDALVTKGVGYNYVQLLVKSDDNANVTGQVPPAGSVISDLRIGRFGWSYSAVPTASGNQISFAFHTPHGDRPVPLSFDAAEGIADRTVDNRPVNLANGFSIAPADPNGETLTAVTGILPLFGTVQGNQVFSVYDSTGSAVGSFDGVFTTTADLVGNYTQAILVTANDGTNVGTAAGQVPPVGSVYNVIYLGGFDEFILYSSLPSPSGDVISIVSVTPDSVANVTPTFINASKSPAVKQLSSPEGYTFVPASELIPSGVNGLPPREVEIQGYQQFDVYDSSGERIGRVDADVTNQWDMFGIYSQAILVTNVADGIGAVPPAGSTFNFVQYGTRGLGTVHSTVPTPNADVTSFKILTPLGNIGFPKVNRPAQDRTDVSFFSPFLTV